MGGMQDLGVGSARRPVSIEYGALRSECLCGALEAFAFRTPSVETATVTQQDGRPTGGAMQAVTLLRFVLFGCIPATPASPLGQGRFFRVNEPGEVHFLASRANLKRHVNRTGSRTWQRPSLRAEARQVLGQRSLVRAGLIVHHIPEQEGQDQGDQLGLPVIDDPTLKPWAELPQPFQIRIRWWSYRPRHIPGFVEACAAGRRVPDCAPACPCGKGKAHPSPR